MTTWKVRSLRLTLFTASDPAAKAGSLEWEELTGAKPDNIMNRGDQNLQEGAFPPGRLVLQRQPGRMDILYVGFPQAEQPEEPVATLGVFEAALETFRSIAQNVFSKSGPCVRLALGAEMVQAADNNLAAYKILVDHMGSATFKLNGGQEFVYQINRPRGSHIIPSLSINRLTRWNASSWQPVRLELGAGVRVLSGPPQIGAVITTDVNTAGERTDPLPSEKLPELFDELREMTLEIRDKGDVL